MKKAFLILLVFISPLLVRAQQTAEQRAKLEAKHGIRDIKLDTPKSKYKDLYDVTNEIYEFDRQSGGFGKDYLKKLVPCGSVYRRKNENLFFGNEKVQKVDYLYINNNLSAILIYLKMGQTIPFRVALDELYGPKSKDSMSSRWLANSFFIHTTLFHTQLLLVVEKNNLNQLCNEIERRENIDSKNKLKKDL